MSEMIIGIVGGLAIFLFGMKVMSEGLQKVAGAKMRKTLSVMTSNRLAGVGTGILVTCGIQSSSATTVMLVGFVHAGLINLTQSIGVIMGANIGTTFTGWLIALIGFKIKITVMALPAISLGFFARFTGSRRLRSWGEVLLGFGLLFLGLDYMKDSVEILKESETVLSWMASTRADTLMGRIVAILIGAGITVIVQSSSATMTITMALAAQGIIDLETASVLVLGQNIGTTVTANIAAIGTSPAAKRTARAHLLFNLFGTVWAIALFVPFYNFIDILMPGSINDGSLMSQAGIAARLAAFHTVFNVISTCIFLPFVSKLAWLARKMVKDPEKPSSFGLKYLDSNLLGSTPMAIHAVRNELKRMLNKVENMFDGVTSLMTSVNKKQGKLADSILADEQIVDMLEKEISEYIIQIGRHEISLEQSHELTGIFNAASDIERIGDHCESLLKLSRRRYDSKLPVSPEATQQLLRIGKEVRSFLAVLSENIFDTSRDLMPKARKIEDTINDMRTKMRADHIKRLNQGTCKVPSGLIYVDMITSMEKIGDHSYNIAEMLAGER